MTFIDFYTAWSIHYMMVGHGLRFYTYYGYGWMEERCPS